MTEPTKQRPGDQVLPTGNEHLPAIQDRIIAEMEESKRVGEERYGQSLRPFNGRNTVQDIREEVRDLFVYLTQLEVESEAARDQLVEQVSAVLRVEGPDDGMEPPVADQVAEAVVTRILGHVTGRLVNSGHADRPGRRPGRGRPW